MENKSFLLVNGDFIYPPNHGGLVDAWNRVKILKNMGYDIDFICTVKEYPKEEYIKIVKKYVNNLYIVFRKNKIKYLFSKKPLQMKSRNALKYINLIKEYDYVFLDGSYVYSILENKTLKYKHSILHMNNNEYIYFNELAQSEKTVWKKIYYKLDAYKFFIMDKYIIEKVKNVMFVSIDEKNFYEKKYLGIKSYFLPVAVEMNLKKQKLNNKNVLFIGALFAPNNKEAVHFYIKNIHPLLMDMKDYKFIIAGNSKGLDIEWIKKIANKYNNIEIIDSPKTLDNIYANASVFVNPMLHGAGVKLKTINAIVNGLPIVSTTIGNQGTGLEHKKHIYVTDNAKKYAEYIKILLNDKIIRETMVRNSQEFISLYYNQEKILSKYLDEIGRS